MRLGTGLGFGARGRGRGITYPLDGVANVTGAWCVSRALLSSFGGALITDAGGGAISRITQQNVADADQDLADQGTTTRRPALVTVGGVAMADFDGTSDNLFTVDALSNFITATEGVMIFAGIIDAYTINHITVFNNDLIAGDSGQFWGFYGQNAGGGTIYGYNYSGGVTSRSAVVPAGTPAVLSLRHKDGQLYFGVNNVESAGTPSDDTGGLTGALRVGGFAAGQFCNMKKNALITLSADPGASALSEIIADLMDHINAE